MRGIWFAAICVVLLAAVSLGMVFFSTAGSGWLAESLSAAAATAGPEWNQRLYRWSLELNPYSASSRLALARLYQEAGQAQLADQLLQEGVAHYSTGPELYLALAASYARQGRLEAACLLLDNAPKGHLFAGMSSLRPQPPAAPKSGSYPAGHPFYLQSRQGQVWYQLDGGEWTLCQGPLRLSQGSHALKLLALSEESIPSPLSHYRYRIEPVRTAAWTPKIPGRPALPEAAPQ